MRGAAIALTAGLAVALGGCAARRHYTADEYFAAAEKEFRSGSYTLAIRTYQELLDQFPFSPHSEEAELRIAHAHYLAGEYVEAIAALTDFQRRHPTSAYLPMVGYLIGMAYKRQMGAIDRDQSAARNAEAYFTNVVEQYPESPYAELAREERADCRRSLAQHELYVARFYHRHGNARAAEQRALEVVGRYPETEAAGEALFQLGELYRAEGNRHQAALAFASVATQYPHNGRAAAARGLGSARSRL